MRSWVKRAKINNNATVSFPATVALIVSSEDLAHAVMALRGFPDGMAMDKYPDEAACEAASPGIVQAQSRCRGSLVLPCTVTVDANGNRTVELINK